MSRCRPRSGVLASNVEMSNLTPIVVEDAEREQWDEVYLSGLEVICTVYREQAEE